MAKKGKLKLSRKKRIVRFLLVLACIGSVLWFMLVMYEVKRVQNNKQPLVCHLRRIETEGVNEYSITCYGLFYKYREYYIEDKEELNAREFTLFFKSFKREVRDYEIG